MFQCGLPELTKMVLSRGLTSSKWASVSRRLYPRWTGQNRLLLTQRMLTQHLPPRLRLTALRKFPIVRPDQPHQPKWHFRLDRIRMSVGKGIWQKLTELTDLLGFKRRKTAPAPYKRRNGQKKRSMDFAQFHRTAFATLAAALFLPSHLQAQNTLEEVERFFDAAQVVAGPTMVRLHALGRDRNGVFLDHGDCRAVQLYPRSVVSDQYFRWGGQKRNLAGKR